MVDIASQKDDRNIPLPEVGITGLRLPIKVKDKDPTRLYQNVIGNFNVFVNVPAEMRGTHMSRIVECIYQNKDDISRSGLQKMCTDLSEKLNTQQVRVDVSFDYFTDAWSPTTNLPNVMTHQCWFSARAAPFEFRMGCAVDIMTVCPCALEECNHKASHVQRGKISIDIKAHPNAWIWLEDLIDISRVSGSARVFDRLKRPDEAHVCIAAFGNPKFVEDVCRDVVIQLNKVIGVEGYKVAIENYESIHQHNAYARTYYNWDE